MNPKFLARLPILLMLFFSGFALLSFAPAHAGAVTLVQQTTKVCSPTISSCALAFASNVAAGDYIILSYEMGSNAGNPCQAATPTDTLTTSWTAGVCATDTNVNPVAIYYGVATASGADTITAKTTVNVPNITMQILEIAGGLSICTASGHSSGSAQPHLATSTCSYTNGYSAFAFFTGGAGAGCGTGFTYVNTYNCYQTSTGGVASPVTYKGTDAGGSVAWAISGITITDTPAASSCPNGDANCYVTGVSCSQTSGTTLVTGSGGCAAWSGANWYGTGLANAFTEVVKVICASSAQYPTSVVSTNFGGLTNGFTTGTTTGQLTATIPSTTNTDPVSLSFWYIQEASGTAQTSDVITTTFANAVPSHGCMMTTGAIIGLNAIMSPYIVGATFTTTGTATTSPNSATSTQFVTSVNTVVTTDYFYSNSGTTGTSSFAAPVAAGKQCNMALSCTSQNDYTMYSATLLDAWSGSEIYVPSTSSYTGTYTVTFTSTASARFVGIGYFVAWGNFANPGTSSTIGSCPVKNNNVFRPANSTQYFYTANNFYGQNMFVTADIGTLFTVTAPVTVVLSVYSTPNSGAISASNPFTLRSSFSVSLNVGQQPFGLTWTPTWTDTSPTGATVGIAIQASNKISINQSSLNGLQTGAAASLTTPAASFTALSASTTDLALCSVNTYQNIVYVTTTSTATATATTTVSGTATTTTTISTINESVLLANNANWPLVFLLLFLPAGVFFGMSHRLDGGILGLIIGAVICLLAGILPAFIFTGLVIVCVSFAIIVNRVGGANG